MTTSDRSLARRGQAWPPAGHCAAVRWTAERFPFSVKVPTRYTPGAKLCRELRRQGACSRREQGCAVVDKRHDIDVVARLALVEGGSGEAKRLIGLQGLRGVVRRAS